jgi:hypothetical protein
MTRSRSATVLVAAAWLVVWGAPVPAWAEGIGHVVVISEDVYIIGGGSHMATVIWYDANNNPVPYSGTVTVSVSHNPKGFSGFTRDDPYWNGAVQHQTDTYHCGARISNPNATPPYGTTLSIPVQRNYSTLVALGVFSFGLVTISANVDGKQGSKSIWNIWIQGRATHYSQGAEYPDGTPTETPGNYCALPNAWAAVNWLGATVLIKHPGEEYACSALLGDVGPLVPLNPYYPPTSQSWNNHWASAGWPPLAVALSGKGRATDGIQFNNQIIDLDDAIEDEAGKTCAENVGLPGGDAIVVWEFDG